MGRDAFVSDASYTDYDTEPRMTDAEKAALLERERARMSEPGYRESLIQPPPGLRPLSPDERLANVRAWVADPWSSPVAVKSTVEFLLAEVDRQAAEIERLRDFAQVVEEQNARLRALFQDEDCAGSLP